MGNATIKCDRYFLLVFPIASYTRVGEIAIVRVLGVTVYKRICSIRWLLGKAWVNKSEQPAA